MHPCTHSPAGSGREKVLTFQMGDGGSPRGPLEGNGGSGRSGLGLRPSPPAAPPQASGRPLLQLSPCTAPSLTTEHGTRQPTGPTSCPVSTPGREAGGPRGWGWGWGSGRSPQVCGRLWKSPFSGQLSTPWRGAASITSNTQVTAPSHATALASRDSAASTSAQGANSQMRSQQETKAANCPPCAVCTHAHTRPGYKRATRTRTITFGHAAETHVETARCTHEPAHTATRPS